jgi:tRNA A-37 threonylcarbamoyl transferase component Bud32/tetratricopeptide (TPR) repeat protein
MDEKQLNSEPDFSQSPEPSGVFAQTGQSDASMAAVSSLLPSYEVVCQVNRGGQGVIYRAIQKYTHREVAIKVMKEGPFAGEMHRSRFQREAKMLSRLKHPNIVTIHETGVAGGYHYFVMDYIEGAPLVEEGVRTKGEIREALGRFAKVCDAVNAAHLQGVIHRDLKPSNILVDEAGEPYVLDFGLAKQDADGLDHSMLTTTGQFLGSIPWAAPEQVEAKPDRIDLRADVYALGVVLYQMLTGEFPYPVFGPTRDVLDHIVNTEPVAPSVRRPLIDNEVETIVLRCLQKDPSRRYQTAGELGRDIERYLTGEAIEAKRDSVTYLVRKRLKRYRVHAAVAAMFVLVVLAGLVASLVLWRQAEEARHSEVTQREQAEVVTSLLSEMVGTADPMQQKGADYTVLQMLDDFVPIIDERTAEMPWVQMQLRHTVADAYSQLQEYFKALEQSDLTLHAYRQAGEIDTVDYALALRTHAGILMPLMKREQAESEYRQVLRILEGHASAGPIEVIETRTRLAKCLAALGKFDEVNDLLDIGDWGDRVNASDLDKIKLMVMRAKSYSLSYARRHHEAIEL